MQKFHMKAVAAALVLGFSSSAVYAGETQVTGFLRAAGALTTGEEAYLEHIDGNGSAGDTHFGLNVARDIGDKVSVAGQLWASGAEGGSFEMVLDWAYASMRAAPGLALNGGKIKYPNLLVSEYVDVGIAYPWVRPPQEMYTFDAEAGANVSLESFVGASLDYSGFAGDLEYGVQLYGGETGLETGGRLSKMLGAKLKVGMDAFSVIGGYNMHMPEETMGDLGLAEKNGKSVSTLSAGVMADVANVLLMAEYAMGKVSDVAEADVTAMYATVGYRIGSVTPHFTYAMREAEEGKTSMTAGVKYQVTPASTFKVDYQMVTPEAEAGMEEESFNVVSVAVDVVF